MANVYQYKVLKDTTEKAVIKLTGKFDGSGQEDNPNRISANTLSGALNANAVPALLSTGGSARPYYGLGISKLWFDSVSETSADLELYWNANGTPNTIFFLSGTYEYNGASNWLTIPNESQGLPGCNGDIGIRTRGMAANSSYTIIIELRKDNAQYQRGQFNDPAAFNYGQYALKP